MTQQIFLTSSVNLVAKNIAQKIGGEKNKRLLYIYTACELKLGESWQEADRNALIKAGLNYRIYGNRKD